MVDTKKLKARIILAGHTQQTLVAAINKEGYKMSKNTLNAKINARAPMNCDDADILCKVLRIEAPAEKAEIFLA